MYYIAGNALLSDADDERTQRIIRNWNAMVRNTDTVFHIGGFATGSSEYYLNQLNGLVVEIAGEEEIEFAGPKFKQLVINPDESYSKVVQPGQEMPVILTNRAEGITEYDHPVIIADRSASWMFKGCGERVIGPDYCYLLNKPVINADIDVLNFRPISLRMIIERYLCS